MHQKKSKLVLCMLILTLILILGGCTEKNSQSNTVSEPRKTTTSTKDETSTATNVDCSSKIQTSPAKFQEMTSQELVDNMEKGWNLGNTLDVCQADRNGDGKVNETVEKDKKVDETLWGNPKTTKKLFEHLKKEDGINAVRIPVTWRDHMGKSPDYQIDEEWMDRVEEVVRYALDEDMYVIINVHHDGGGDPQFGAWIQNAANSEKEKKEVLNRYKAVWSQISNRFENYSDKLIFESLNEVGFDALPQEDAYALLNEFNQIFVDLIRSGKGNNPKRHLLIAGMWTDIEKTCNTAFQMPKDSIADRLLLSVHYYTPWQFCVCEEQNKWGNKAEREEMQYYVQKIADTYVKKGTPVIIGEYGFGDNDPKSCLKFTKKFTQLCNKNHIASFLWDNGRLYDREKFYWKLDGLGKAIQKK